jgi:hypothetical protein
MPIRQEQMVLFSSIVNHSTFVKKNPGRFISNMISVSPKENYFNNFLPPSGGGGKRRVLEEDFLQL